MIWLCKATPEDTAWTSKLTEPRILCTMHAAFATRQTTAIEMWSWIKQIMSRGHTQVQLPRNAVSICEIHAFQVGFTIVATTEYSNPVAVAVAWGGSCIQEGQKKNVAVHNRKAQDRFTICKNSRARDRTGNLLGVSETPWPLGHTTAY